MIPTITQARQWTGIPTPEITYWAGPNIAIRGDTGWTKHTNAEGSFDLMVPTPDGEIAAKPGDWILLSSIGDHFVWAKAEVEAFLLSQGFFHCLNKKV